MRIKIGSITARRDRPGYWWATYYIDGKRHRKSFQRLAYPSKGAVREGLCRELNEEVLEPSKATPLSAAIEEFFRVNQNSLRSSSVTSYRLHLDRLVRAYGEVPLTKLTLADLEEWVAAFERTGVSPASVNLAIRTLRRFWNWAEARGDVSKNAAKGLRLRRVPERSGSVLIEAEIPRFLENCTPLFRPIAEVALYAGLRLGEVINLKWNAVDLEQGTITIRNDGDFRTKSGKHRLIPIHPQLAQTLKGLERKSDYVFCNEAGERRADKTSWFRMSVQEAADRAGIKRKLNFHSLRHTFATRLAMFAGDMEAARRILGHADVQTTRLYVHPTDQLVNAVRKMPSVPVKEASVETTGSDGK